MAEADVVLASSGFDVVDASIVDLRSALENGTTTSVEIVTQCLHRIRIFAEAIASDNRRTRGEIRGPLDGIPFTVKDSYMVRGMTCANGSPAFRNLLSKDDAHVVRCLRNAGGVLLGKTNMPPMAYGGMQRGVYGRAENPYNKDYLAAAFASGSSNGSAVSTAASFAVFGMGAETVSSGRSPASNNALVAYTPSKGLISCRGNWPLYPTCDVMVPQTRTVEDMFEVLNVITEPDKINQGDFYRSQNFVSVPNGWRDRPKSFQCLADNASLAGLTIAVPSSYVGGSQLPHAQDVYVSPGAVALWERARLDLEAAGATVKVVEEFPLIQVYENPPCALALGYENLPELPGGTPAWNRVERSTLIARAYDAFLRDNADERIPNLKAAEAGRMFPALSPDHPQIAYAEPTNAIHWEDLVNELVDRESEDPWQALMETDNLEDAVCTLEIFRKVLFEKWLADNKFDIVVFPSAGDVGAANADVSHPSAKHAWTNGVKYSNGNRALRHLGVPSVTVPMGLMQESGMPVGLSFFGPAYSDARLLQYAKAYESMSRRRTPPPLTPSLLPPKTSRGLKLSGTPPALNVEKFSVASAGSSEDTRRIVSVQGTVTINTEAEILFNVFVDSKLLSAEQVQVQRRRPESDSGSEVVFSFNVQTLAEPPPQWTGWESTEAMVARDQTMVVILASMVQSGRETRSLPCGWYGLG